MRGWIYVMTNPAMPGLVKVGFTMSDPAIRAQELDTTGVPQPYIVAYEAVTVHPRRLEARTHARLSAVRMRTGREFFKCSTDDAVAAIHAEADAGREILLETHAPALRHVRERMVRDYIRLGIPENTARRQTNAVLAAEHGHCDTTQYFRCRHDDETIIAANLRALYPTYSPVQIEALACMAVAIAPERRAIAEFDALATRIKAAEQQRAATATQQQRAESIARQHAAEHLRIVAALPLAPAAPSPLADAPFEYPDAPYGYGYGGIPLSKPLPEPSRSFDDVSFWALMIVGTISMAYLFMG